MNTNYEQNHHSPIYRKILEILNYEQEILKNMKKSQSPMTYTADVDVSNSCKNVII